MYGIHVNVFTGHKNLQYMFTKKELNIRQIKWFELLEDYDMSVLYYPVKNNVVVHALSHITMGNVSYIEEDKKVIVKYDHRLARLGVSLEDSSNGGIVVHHNSKSYLVVNIKSNQHFDPLLMELKKSVLGKLNDSFSQGKDGVHRSKEEAHGSRYLIHSNATKRYGDL